MRQAVNEKNHRNAKDYDDLNQFYQQMDASLDDMAGVKEGWSFLDLLCGPLPTEETFAHVTFLVNTGKVVCNDSDPAGVLRYRLA